MFIYYVYIKKILCSIYYPITIKHLSITINTELIFNFHIKSVKSKALSNLTFLGAALYH